MQIGDLTRFKEDGAYVEVKYDDENFTRHMTVIDSSIYLILDMNPKQSKIVYTKNMDGMHAFWVQTEHLKKL